MSTNITVAQLRKPELPTNMPWTYCFCLRLTPVEINRALLRCENCWKWYHDSCLRAIDSKFTIPSGPFQCPICSWHDSTRQFNEASFDVDGAIETLTILEKAASSAKTRETTRLAEAADSLKRDFEALREKGTTGDTTHRGREKARSRSSTAIRDEWAQGIRHKIDRLKDTMGETHVTELPE